MSAGAGHGSDREGRADTRYLDSIVTGEESRSQNDHLPQPKTVLHVALAIKL